MQPVWTNWVVNHSDMKNLDSTALESTKVSQINFGFPWVNLSQNGEATLFAAYTLRLSFMYYLTPYVKNANLFLLTFVKFSEEELYYKWSLIFVLILNKWKGYMI